MTSPGKYLIELAEHLEADLAACNRSVSCVDLAYGSSVTSPIINSDCNLKVDVGPDQNPFRLIDLNTGQILYARKPGCSHGWRFNGVVRVTGPYVPDPGDCCHEHTRFTYEFTNTVAIVSESIFAWLEQQDDGESVQTEYVTSYNGGAVTVAINFSMRVCMPTCEDLLEEERFMLGEIDGLKKEKGC